jgi:hypothetical protein
MMGLVIAASIAGIYNVYADGSAVQRQARAVACQARAGDCKLRLTRVGRTPFYQEIQFQEGRRTVNTRCTRSFYLVGDYACRAQDGGP